MSHSGNLRISLDQLDQSYLPLLPVYSHYLQSFKQTIFFLNHVSLCLCPCYVLLHRFLFIQSYLFLWPSSCTTSFNKTSLHILSGSVTHSSFIYHIKCYLLYEAFSDFFRQLQTLFPQGPTLHLELHAIISHCIEIILLCAHPHKTEFLSGMDWTLFVFISSLFSPKYLVFVK